MPKNLEISYLLDFYGDVLSPKQRDIMEQYYNDDLSLAEISENFGITRQGVRDAIKRAESILLELEEKVGVVKRYGAVQQSIPILEQLAKKIQRCNQSGDSVSQEIEQDCQNMLKILSSISE